MFFYNLYYMFIYMCVHLRTDTYVYLLLSQFFFFYIDLLYRLYNIYERRERERKREREREREKERERERERENERMYNAISMN